MEDIVAVKVKLESDEDRYFLTWGRVHDTVDPKPLEAAVLANSPRFALRGRAVSAEVCSSLQVASSAPYFYECFFSMCQRSIPFGPDYEQWAKEMREAIGEGRELYYLGV